MQYTCINIHLYLSFYYNENLYIDNVVTADECVDNVF